MMQMLMMMVRNEDEDDDDDDDDDDDNDDGEEARSKAMHESTFRSEALTHWEHNQQGTDPTIVGKINHQSPFRQGMDLEISAQNHQFPQCPI